MIGWLFSKKNKEIFVKDNEMFEKIKKYPRPFRVTTFVDHYVVLDANGSECKYMKNIIEWSLNRMSDIADNLGEDNESK